MQLVGSGVRARGGRIVFPTGAVVGHNSRLYNVYLALCLTFTPLYPEIDPRSVAAALYNYN